MTLTKEQLDKLCGGAPRESRHCPYRSCDRVVGPYYSAGMARDALSEHIRWVHITDSSAPTVVDGETWEVAR